ncbi:MAG: Fe-S cluster assembly protein SufB [Candidatus Woesearchaeota archaeon]
MNVNITRELYDHYDDVESRYTAPEGLTEDTVRSISTYKNEPEWMLQKRLDALKTFFESKMPNWGPSLEKLDLNKITYFVIPKAEANADNWEKVPENIKRTFEKLGIPEAERQSLAGVGAQYDSQVVYHKIRDDLKEKGVIFEDMDVAVQKYPDIVKKYFMKNVKSNLHKFAALHGAVWSGGTFIYVPKNTKVDMPLQAYFRMNTKKGGQFEHTLIIVDEGAQLSYIEGCFTKGNKIITSVGYKNIEDIRGGDYVLTDQGTFNKVTHTMKRPYAGELFEIETYGSNRKIIVTPEHPFLYVDREKKNERNKKNVPRWNMPVYFKKGDYLAMPINNSINKNKFYEFKIMKGVGGKFVEKNIKVPLIPEFFRLIGYYLSEGSISGGYYLNFSFNIKERSLIDDVKHCLMKVFGVDKTHENIHKKNNGISIVVNSVELCRIFENFGKGNQNKNIPSWIMFEDLENQKELIKTWFLGDGNYYNKRTSKNWLKESFRINTTSETLAYQARDIMLRLGIVSFINARDRAKEGRKILYTVGITGRYMHMFGKLLGEKINNRLNDKNRATMFSIDKNFAYFPIKSIRKFNSKTIVYNFSVEEQETYTVNGFAVHNCSAPLYNASSIHAGCVEVFVHKNARMRYSSVENWSKNTFNLNTKRAIVEENGIMEWIGGNMGSGCTMLYPTSLLVGKNSRADHISIAYAGPDQNQDTGSKVYHLAENTSSTIKSKSISKDGGITAYRGLIKIAKGAINSKCSVSCDALMFDNKSQSNTYPTIDVEEEESDVVHEATVGKISEDQIFYLQSRGISAEDAVRMIVSGFIEPLVRELPLEYAVEMNRLIELEMEGSLG